VHILGEIFLLPYDLDHMSGFTGKNKFAAQARLPSGIESLKT
jgi:hypothetical protein